MALSALSVYIDPPPLTSSQLPPDGIHEFSRNEDGRHQITAYITPTPNDANNVGEILTVSLYKARRDRLEEIVQSRQTITLNGTVPTNGSPIVFDLRRIVYSIEKTFTMCRFGMYFVKVTHTGGTTGPSAVEADSSPDFRVTPLTTEAFEHRYLEGATRQSNDDRMARTQPTRITGVKITEVSRNHPLGSFTLNLVYDNQTPPMPTLVWRNGLQEELVVEVPSGINNLYTIMGDDEESFITVMVDPRLLPATDKHERVIIDKLKVTRQTLRDWIDTEVQWIEQSFLFTPIDPALIVSDDDLTSLNIGPGAGLQNPPVLPQNFDYDIKKNALTYYPTTNARWISLKVPMYRPITFEYLVGILGNARVIDVALSWISMSSHDLIELMPFNQATAFNYIGMLYVGALRGAINLPSMWRYRYYAGLTDEVVPAQIIDCIGLRAAVRGLAVLGMMFRGGLAGHSISKDGVSESASYTASASYGLYSATIVQYEKRLETLEKQLKGTYLGIPLSVL